VLNTRLLAVDCIACVVCVCFVAGPCVVWCVGGVVVAQVGPGDDETRWSSEAGDLPPSARDAES
jgi:hypothetical protein